MLVYNIHGVDVDFPFDAYDCQITYMDRVLQSLQQGNNALLESPTGIGKMLCLLCSALAWRRTFGEFLQGGSGSQHPSSSQQSGGSGAQSSPYPVIIYASRTHSQLRQVIKELKATIYRRVYVQMLPLLTCFPITSLLALRKLKNASNCVHSRGPLKILLINNLTLKTMLSSKRVQKRLAVLNKHAKGSCSCISLLLSVVAIVILAVIVLLLINCL